MKVSIINPGELRVELGLERMVPTPDGLGGFAEAWEAVTLVFAKIEPRSTRSSFGADQTLEEVTQRITVRHHSQLASGMRLRRGGRIFEILTVHDPDETGRYLVIAAREQGL
ncbi:MAG: phage head closure protein [Mesorhizobium sp.]